MRATAAAGQNKKATDSNPAALMITIYSKKLLIHIGSWQPWIFPSGPLALRRCLSAALPFLRIIANFSCLDNIMSFLICQ